jgi:hypothetical protein
MEFATGTSLISSGCLNPQAYTCLRSFILPDGTVVAGDVQFEGENGIVISTEYIDLVPVLRFDAIGVPDLPDCICQSKPLEYLSACQTGVGGALMIDQTDNIIGLATPYTLQEFCAANDPTAILNAARANGCNPPIPVPCTPPPAHDCVCIDRHYADYYIWPVSDTVGVMPVILQPSVADQLPSPNPINLPARPRQGLKLYLKGVTP